MGCAACQSFDDAERAAIEGRDLLKLPEHTLDGCTCESESTIALTLLRPERLALSPQRGTSVEVTWAELLRWILSPLIADDKASAGGFVFAQLRDGIRRASSVETVSALALDHDEGGMTLEDAHAKLHRYRHIVLSTASHAPEKPRWRAIVAVSRPMLVDEHSVVWARASRVMASDAPVDRSAKDPCRLWFAPTVRPGSSHVVLSGEGAPLDVDRMLAAVGARAPSVHLTSTLPVVGDRYVQAALEAECAAVASSGLGARNSTLNRAAFALARLPLHAADIANALLSAAIRSGLPEREARKTITSALRARRRK